MNKIDKLTKSQEDALFLYKEKWLNKIFNYELHNNNTFESVKNGIKKLYQFCNLKEPIVLLLDSPFACQIAANIFKNKDQVENQVENQVRNQVRNQVWDQVWDQVGNQVGNQVKNQVENTPFCYVPFSSYINYSDFGWLSFYEFFNKEVGLIQDFKEKLDSIISFTESSFMSIQLEGLCIVSKYPSKIIRNAENNLHNIEGAAIEFSDGYKQYYFNGINISEDLYNKLTEKSYTFEDWSKEENEEVRSLVLAFYEEKFGGEFVYRFLSRYLKEVDNYVDKKDNQYLKKTVKSMNIGVYTLFKGNVNNIDIAYVRCYCPSTDRMFMLGVHPSFNDAKSAISSLCQIPIKLKPHLKTIARQGEIYSFTFDNIGTDLLKNKELSKDDFQNVVSLKGDEYFSKLKFEY